MQDRNEPTPTGVVPIPNPFFDALLPALSDGELRLLLVIYRATLGWREGAELGGWRFKRRDWISHRQLITRTGRGSSGVTLAIQRLIDRGLLIVEDSGGRALTSAAERRRYMGRLYFRPVDMWITPSLRRMAQPGMTTYKRHNKREKRQAKNLNHKGGLTRVSSLLPPG